MENKKYLLYVKVYTDGDCVCESKLDKLLFDNDCTYGYYDKFDMDFLYSKSKAIKILKDIRNHIKSHREYVTENVKRAFNEMIEKLNEIREEQDEIFLQTSFGGNQETNIYFMSIKEPKIKNSDFVPYGYFELQVYNVEKVLINTLLEMEDTLFVNPYNYKPLEKGFKNEELLERIAKCLAPVFMFYKDY